MVVSPTDQAVKIAVGWQCIDRETLITYCDGFINGLGHQDAPYLRIVLPCGNVREYSSRTDIPVRSIQCGCGEVDYDHWFIRYEKEENDGSN